MLNINGNLRESDVFPRLTGRERETERQREKERDNLQNSNFPLIPTAKIKCYLEVKRVTIV